MNIKKIVPAILALSLLTACGGESGETVQTGTQTSISAVQTTASTTAAVTTASTAAATEATTTASTAATTAAATSAATTAAATTAANASSAKATNSAVPSGQKTKLAALGERIKNNPNGAVKMLLTENIDTTKIEIVSYTAGKKSRVETDMIGFKMVVVNDGTNSYTLAPDDKVFAKGESKDIDSTGDMNGVFDAVNDSSQLKLLNSGTEKYKGKDCGFEEYEGKDDEGKKETYKFYFDKDGNVVGLGFSEKTMQEIAQSAKNFSIDFSVTLDEKPDEAMFTVPKDYKEITQEEIGMKILEKMFGGLGDLLEQSGAGQNQAG